MKSLHQFIKGILLVILLSPFLLCSNEKDTLEEYFVVLDYNDTIFLEKKNETELIGNYYIRMKNDVIGLLGRDNVNFINPVFRLYDNRGQLIFEKDAYRFKGRPIAFKDFYTTDDYVYLFAGKLLLKYKWNGELVSTCLLNKKIIRSFPLSEQFMTYIENEQQFIVNSFPKSNITVKGDENYYQKSSPIFMLVDSLGLLVKSFGHYPKEYNVSTNNLSPSIAIGTSKNRIYYVTHTSPDIIIYDYTGEYHGKIEGIHSKNMDYRITPNTKKMETIQDAMSRTKEDRINSYNDRYVNFDVLPNEGYRYYIENRDTYFFDYRLD